MKSKYHLILSTLTASSLYAAPPEGLKQSVFADVSMTPSPACLSAHPNGDVFVGVDMLGSLGKGANKGRIVKLIDEDNDGKADKHITFAKVDNPRGLIAVGNKLYVLHTVIPEETGVLTGMYFSVLEDKDGDHIADGPAKHLIKNISCKESNIRRGADHTTNGIRMGIDGWIYVALGDFGFVDAVGSDGKKMTKLGGGVFRVRPDGSEMEMYTDGLRNIYDVAIDPFMNIYTRGNTNDGGGWNIRFIHHIQSADYGYPMLFKGFTEEILPALADLGTGSGTGSMFFQEPGWPAKYNNVPLMADWGRSQLYIHRITPDGASFKQTQENFITSSQVADVDVDGSGRMYLAAWAGAGYKGNPNRGMIEIVVPTDWSYKAFPELKKASEDKLIELLQSDSAKARLHSQQELIRRKDNGVKVLAIAKNTEASLEARVAAIFTYAQLAGTAGHDALVSLTEDKDVEEFALRVLADRIPSNQDVPLAPFYKALKSDNPRVQAAATIGLGRLGKIEAAQALLDLAIVPEKKVEDTETTVSPAVAEKKENLRQGGPHDVPNSAIILPHLAVKSLIHLHAVEACLAAIDGKSQDGALWALRYMHDEKVVKGLISKLESTSDAKLKLKLVTALARLYTKEAEYDGSWWWNTRPDTRGPYYVPVKWESSALILEAFNKFNGAADAETKLAVAAIAKKHRMFEKKEEPAVKNADPAMNKNIAKTKVGDLSIENVILGLEKVKGNLEAGKKHLKLGGPLACAGCHEISGKKQNGNPNLSEIGSVLDRAGIAEAILKPDATIAENWCEITDKSGNKISGTIASTDEKKTVLYMLGGIRKEFNTAEIKIKKQSFTMMGPHLADNLTMQQLADVVDFLHSQKKTAK